jgi:outer membrane protein assembly factor BamB
MKIFTFFPILILTATLALGEDWPQWRGPLRDDISTEKGLLKEWPAGGPTLAWKVTGMGEGYSGVSVAKGRIYTMGDRNGAGYLIALDAANGKEIWATKVGQAGGGGGFPGPRCTPTVSGDNIIALGQYGDLICVAAADGKERWRHNLQKDFGGKVMSGWGFAESPLVDDGKVICNPGGPQGTMLALSESTGEVIWRCKEWTDNAAYTSIIIATINGVRQYILLTDANVGGVSPKDGSLLWRAPFPGKAAVIPTPIFADDSVYVACGYDVGSALYKISSATNASGFAAQKVYATKLMKNHHGGVVKVGDYLYGYSDGTGWTCQNFKTGEAVWQEKAKLPKGSLSCADGLLYLRSESGPGTVVLLEPTPAGWTEKGRFDQPNRSDKNSWPHPVIANGCLYLRDKDSLFCYDVKQKP